MPIPTPSRRMANMFSGLSAAADVRRAGPLRPGPPLTPGQRRHGRRLDLGTDWFGKHSQPDTSHYPGETGMAHYGKPR
jgi:hypothetical protein